MKAAAQSNHVWSRLDALMAARIVKAPPVAVDPALPAGPGLERYAADPVAFARDVLGYEPWSRQREMLRSIVSHERVAVRSGHKVGKSRSAATLALWWYATRPIGQVVMTSATDRQVKDTLWPEFVEMFREAVRRGHHLGGDPAVDPGTGLRHPDNGKHRVIGFATKKTENMGGYSGDLLFIVDEASGVDQQIYEAMRGNLGGGGRMILWGNPTSTSGFFYDAFNGDSNITHPIHVDSRDSPNITGSEPSVPGLATKEWVQEMLIECGGEGSPEFQIRVGGEFPEHAASAVIGREIVKQAQERWRDGLPDSAAPLEFGLDCARYGDDDSVIAPRRGRWIYPLEAHHGLDGPTLAAKVLALVEVYGRKNAQGKLVERPRVKVDMGGGWGTSPYDVLARHEDLVEVVGVNPGEAATVQGYLRLRDQLWFEARAWLESGGMLPPDKALAQELIAPSYRVELANKRRVEPKDDVKARLKRSPDRADALCLAVYNPPSYTPPTLGDMPAGAGSFRAPRHSEAGRPASWDLPGDDPNDPDLDDMGGGDYGGGRRR